MEFKIKHIDGALSETTQEELDRRKDRVVEVMKAWKDYLEYRKSIGEPDIKPYGRIWERNPKLVTQKQDELRKNGFEIVMFGIIDRSPEFFGDRYYIYHDTIELKSRECFRRIADLIEEKNKRWDEEMALKLLDAGFRKNEKGDWV